MDLVGEDLSILMTVLGAGIDDIQTGMVSRKGRVDDGLDISLNVQEAQTTIGRMEAIDVEGMLRFGSARSVGCDIGGYE